MHTTPTLTAVEARRRIDAAVASGDEAARMTAIEWYEHTGQITEAVANQLIEEVAA